MTNPYASSAYDSAFPNPAQGRGEGMSMREWYAAMAMQGILASGMRAYSVADMHKKTVARDAFHIADAMLAEAAKGGAA